MSTASASLFLLDINHISTIMNSFSRRRPKRWPTSSMLLQTCGGCASAAIVAIGKINPSLVLTPYQRYSSTLCSSPIKVIIHEESWDFISFCPSSPTIFACCFWKFPVLRITSYGMMESHITITSQRYQTAPTMSLMAATNMLIPFLRLTLNGG
jgi:hypothetical protein